MADDCSERATRPSLLVRLRDPRDAVSWRNFVDIYGPLIYGHCRRRGLRHEDAEDVTQRVFLKISEAIQQFTYQPEVGRFRDWLGTVVRNEINRFLRQSIGKADGRGGVEGERLLDAALARDEETAWTAEFNGYILQTALDRSRPHFEADTWRAFERVWLENRPAVEVARELGQALAWVYVAKSRVLKRLWQEVQELADDTTLYADWSSRSDTP